MIPSSDWMPGASLATLRHRAGFLAEIRRFFAERQVLEVETPILSSAGTTDPNIESMTSRYPGTDSVQKQCRYLHTSPEFAMKRLLAAGSGPIYQIARVFRQGELGRLHNPEFSLLEWYRPGFELQTLMQEVADLVSHLTAGLLDIAPAEHLTYADAFCRHAGIDPFRATVDELQACATGHGIAINPDVLRDRGRDAWLDLLLTHVVEDRLGRGRLCFLHDYPASQAALAKVRPGEPAVAERFELYLEGIELANGFQELADAQEQQRRFEADQALRRQRGQDDVAMDECLLAALQHGLPDGAGVALGLDRLIMLATGKQTVAEVMAFAWERA